VGPDELGAAVVAAVDGAVADVSFGQLSVDVPAERWVDAAGFVRDDPAVGCAYLDWLSAYDDSAAASEPAIAVVVHLWSVAHKHHLRLRTRLTGDRPRLASLTPLWAGANWHERETFEMFGIVFDGHPALVPLLLPDGFEGHPLRKEFVLASRVAKPWPGAKDPAEPEDGGPGRRRMQPPGVPDPDVWGPDAVAPAAAEAAETADVPEPPA
jgi:NADH-quinone oxidoreductase subunit C